MKIQEEKEQKKNKKNELIEITRMTLTIPIAKHKKTWID